jgi:hypothetical protein
MSANRSKIIVSKLEAAKRQLRTAIRLWFADGDPIAIHTLAFAAYEIIHVVSKKRNPHRPTLIFDSDMIKDKYRPDWNKSIKRTADFFKHANRDPDGSIEFVPETTIIFLMACLSGLRTMKEAPDREGFAFFYWLCFHKPEWIKLAFRKTLEDRISVKGIAEIKSVKKTDFLKIFDLALKS